MNIIKLVILVLGVFGGISLAQAQSVTLSESRGGLLYSMHCSKCHTSVIHWRERKLATDWGSLKAQVNRWQSYSKLGWREEDIIDVTYYLNIHYYNFLSTEPKALTQSNEIEKTLHGY